MGLLDSPIVQSHEKTGHITYNIPGTGDGIRRVRISQKDQE